MPVADLLNMIMNFVTLAGVIAIAAWALWWVRAQRKMRAEIRAEIRTLIREVGRLRMSERDTTELSRKITEIRRMLDRPNEPDEYTKGFLDAMENPPRRPPLRSVRGGFPYQAPKDDQPRSGERG